MEKQLAKEPEWKMAYASQVHEMVNHKAAVKLSKEVLQSWTGPVWYISHLIAPNLHPSEASMEQQPEIQRPELERHTDQRS